MFGPLGVPEILFILVLALLIFGPRKLPEVGRTLGKAMGEFRRATTELKRSVNTEIALEEDDERPRYTRSARPDRQSEEGDEARREAENRGPEAAAGQKAAAGTEAAGTEAATGGGAAEATASAAAASGDAEASSAEPTEAAGPTGTVARSSRGGASGPSDGAER